MRSERLSSLGKLYPGLKTCSDAGELINDPQIDAVIIASPDATHSVMLKHAVEAGKDVYCEKPMGTVFSEAKAAYLAVKKSKQVVQIGTQRRSEGAGSSGSAR